MRMIQFGKGVSGGVGRRLTAGGRLLHAGFTPAMNEEMIKPKPDCSGLEHRSASGLTVVGFKRLRWIMIGAILVDAFNTCWGQPDSYWSNPATVSEHNSFVRYFAKFGPVPFLIYWVGYAAVAWGIVSLLPRRFALVAMVAYILPHYFGASTWWVYEWDYGANAAAVYGFVLAMAIGWALGTKERR